ncbi:MAG TPA: hypothetical protein VL979_15190 [Solirubrobacteraceae bacterium]|nr:hypothetical protein [Solirubrobacteraceae bacterium]
MRGGWRSKAASTGALLAALALAACGGSGSHPTTATQTADVSSTASQAATSAESTEKVPNVNLAVHISVLHGVAGARTIPRRYTCDGADASPPVSWGKVPSNTAEIDLFVVSLENGSEYASWAVAGIPAKARSLSAGRLPHGAVVGRNRFGRAGYSLCPRKGKTGTYTLLVDPLPRRIPAKSGFNPEQLLDQVIHTAEVEGELSFSYKRA